MDVPVSFSEVHQRSLEEAVSAVLHDQKIRIGNAVVLAKGADDEQIQADLLADDHYRAVAHAHQGVYFSEESSDLDPPKLRAFGEAHGLVYIADPIDGSSEFVRAGPMRSPLTTAVMVVRDGKVLAAVVGDVWTQQIYSIGMEHGRLLGLYARKLNSNARVRLSLSMEKRNLSLKEAMVAGYAPNHKHNRIDLLEPLFASAAYVHNNGGQPFALRVVEGQHNRSYAVALELAPKELWEHIGPILASIGGATVSQLDGSPLQIDPLLRQTSITSANPKLAVEVRRLLAASYERHGVLYLEKID